MTHNRILNLIRMNTLLSYLYMAGVLAVFKMTWSIAFGDIILMLFFSLAYIYFTDEN